MALVEILGNYPAKLRCYSFHSPAKAGPRTATHLRSAASFNSFKDMQELFVNQVKALKSTPFLFISKQHLPHDLTDQIEGFPEFFRYLAFAENIWQKRQNAFTFPSSLKENSGAGFYPIPGFPATKAQPEEGLTREILSRVANIFGMNELKDFLGEFHQDAGHIIFLSNYYNSSLDECRGNVLDLLKMLAGPIR